MFCLPRPDIFPAKEIFDLCTAKLLPFCYYYPTASNVFAIHPKEIDVDIVVVWFLVYETKDILWNWFIINIFIMDIVVNISFYHWTTHWWHKWNGGLVYCRSIIQHYGGEWGTNRGELKNMMIDERKTTTNRIFDGNEVITNRRHKYWILVWLIFIWIDQ